MITNDTNTDPLYILLQRAIYEDGTPEGDNAWSLFKRKVNGQAGKLVFVTGDFANPLMYIVVEHEKRILELETENNKLTLNSCPNMVRRRKSAR